MTFKQDKSLSNTLFSMFKTVFQLLLFVHYLCCLMIYVGEYGKESWLNKLEIESKISRYITSYYFITTTTTTIGYGEITAATNLEYIIMMII